MEITIIKIGYSVKQIITGKPTKQLEDLVENLKKNPLIDEEVIMETRYTDKSLYEICCFLGIE